MLINTWYVAARSDEIGEALNVIPESVALEGTVRTFTIPVLDLIERRMRELSEGIGQAFELSVDFRFPRNYPPTINHAAETDFVRRALTELKESVR